MSSISHKFCLSFSQVISTSKSVVVSLDFQALPEVSHKNSIL